MTFPEPMHELHSFKGGALCKLCARQRARASPLQSASR
jgi:hypothetical protein